MNHRPRMTNFLTTDLYGITTEEFCRGRGNVATVRLMLEAGIKVIQYREKDKSARRMFEECRIIRDLTRQAGATFIVNDRIDLALLVEADGVHIGQDDLPVTEVRKLVGQDLVIGLSTNLPEQALAADKQGIVDYLGVGPIFATATKKDAASPVGLAYLDYVVQNITLPFVPIGGIKESNIAEVRRHGAKIFCLISDLTGAPDLPAKVRALRSEVAGASA